MPVGKIEFNPPNRTTGQQSLFGASLVNFSLSLGYAGNPSQLTAKLVVDDSHTKTPTGHRRDFNGVNEGYHSYFADGRVLVDNSSHAVPPINIIHDPINNTHTPKYPDTPKQKRMDPQTGEYVNPNGRNLYQLGDFFQPPELGSPVWFRYDTYYKYDEPGAIDQNNNLVEKGLYRPNPWEFNGILTSYNRTHSTSEGEIFEVKIDDPRTILSGTQVILSSFDRRTAPADEDHQRIKYVFPVENDVANPGAGFGSRVNPGLEINRVYDKGYIGTYNVINPFGFYENKLKGYDFGQRISDHSEYGPTALNKQNPHHTSDSATQAFKKNSADGKVYKVGEIMPSGGMNPSARFERASHAGGFLWYHAGLKWKKGTSPTNTTAFDINSPSLLIALQIMLFAPHDRDGILKGIKHNKPGIPKHWPYYNVREPFGGPLYFGENETYTTKYSQKDNYIPDISEKGPYRYKVDLSELFKLSYASTSSISGPLERDQEKKSAMLPNDFRIRGSNMSLLELITHVCDTASHDFFVELLPDGVWVEGTDTYIPNDNSLDGVIKIHVIPRISKPKRNVIRNEIDRAESDPSHFWYNRIISDTVGYEFSDEIAGSFIYGAPKTRVVGVTRLGNDDFRLEYGVCVDNVGTPVNMPDDLISLFGYSRASCDGYRKLASGKATGAHWVALREETEYDGVTTPADSSSTGSKEDRDGYFRRQLSPQQNTFSRQSLGNTVSYQSWYRGNDLKNDKFAVSSKLRTIDKRLGNRFRDRWIDIYPCWGKMKKRIVSSTGKVYLENEGRPILGSFDSSDPHRDFDGDEYRGLSSIFERWIWKNDEVHNFLSIRGKEDSLKFLNRDVYEFRGYRASWIQGQENRIRYKRHKRPIPYAANIVWGDPSDSSWTSGLTPGHHPHIDPSTGKYLPYLLPTTATIEIDCKEAGFNKDYGSGIGVYLATVTELRSALRSFDAWRNYIKTFNPRLCEDFKIASDINALMGYVLNNRGMDGIMAANPHGTPTKPARTPVGLSHRYESDSPLQEQSDDSDTTITQAADATNKRNSAGNLKRTSDHYNFLEKMYERISDTAKSYYGKQFLVPLPFDNNDIESYRANKFADLANTKPTAIFNNKWDIAQAGWVDHDFARKDIFAQNSVNYPKDASFFDNKGMLKPFLMFPAYYKPNTWLGNGVAVQSWNITDAGDYNLGEGVLDNAPIIVIESPYEQWVRLKKANLPNLHQVEANARTALVVAILEDDENSPDFGKVKEIEVMDTGFGYQTGHPVNILTCHQASPSDQVRINFPNCEELVNGRTGESTPVEIEPNVVLKNSADYTEKLYFGDIGEEQYFQERISFATTVDEDLTDYGLGILTWTKNQEDTRVWVKANVDSETYWLVNEDEEGYCQERTASSGSGGSFVINPGLRKSTCISDTDYSSETSTVHDQGFERQWVPNVSPIVRPYALVSLGGDYVKFERDDDTPVGTNYDIKPLVDYIMGVRQENVKLSHDAFGIDNFRKGLVSAAVKPWMGAVPQKGTRDFWGPWANTSNYGKCEFRQEQSLAPENYGSISKMNFAGLSIAKTDTIHSQSSESGSMEIVGPPEHKLGSQILRHVINAPQNELGPYITDITVDVNEQGVFTRYNMQTWKQRFGRMARYQDEEARRKSDRISQLAWEQLQLSKHVDKTNWQDHHNQKRGK